eukprot:1058264-Amphidinium_carterae.1
MKNCVWRVLTRDFSSCRRTWPSVFLCMLSSWIGRKLEAIAGDLPGLRMGTMVEPRQALGRCCVRKIVLNCCESGWENASLLILQASVGDLLGADLPGLSLLRMFWTCCAVVAMTSVLLSR